MNSLLILVRVQIRALAHSLKPGTQKAGIVAVALALIVLIAIAELFMFLLGLMLVSFGFAPALPAFAIAAGAIVGVVFTFLKANGTLFNLADFDLVMSLPISRRVIVASRIAALYGSAMLMGAVISTPLWVAYFMALPLSAWTLICAVITTLLAPAIPTALATFLAFGVNVIASRFRRANIVYIVVSLVAYSVLFFVIYGNSFTGSAGSGELSDAELESGLSTLSSVFSMGWPPAAWAAEAIAGSVPALLAFIIASIAIPALGLEIMQRNYLAINAALAARARGRALSSGELKKQSGKSSSAFTAIVLKEFRTLLGIPSYAFNTLFGYIFILVVALAISVVGLEQILISGAIDGIQITSEEYQLIVGFVANLLPWVFVFCTIMCPSSVCSISIEGKNAWIMATAPLDARTVLGAKLASNAVPVAATLAVGALCMLISGQIDALSALEVFLTSYGVFFLMVNIGLMLDARKPNYAWASPNEVVKRGLPMMVVIIGGMLVTLAGGAAAVVLSLKLNVAAGTIWNFAIGAACLGAGWLIFQRSCRRTTFYLGA